MKPWLWSESTGWCSEESIILYGIPNKYLYADLFFLPTWKLELSFIIFFIVIRLQFFFQMDIVEYIKIFNESPNIQRSQKCDIFKKDHTWEPGVNIQKIAWCWRCQSIPQKGWRVSKRGKKDNLDNWHPWVWKSNCSFEHEIFTKLSRYVISNFPAYLLILKVIH